MKLLLDEGLPHSTIRRLRESRFDAAHVRDLGLASASDLAILEFSRRED